MNALWIAIETTAAVTECAAMLYFVNSRFDSKRHSKRLLFIAFSILCIIDISFTIAKLPIMEVPLTIVMALYLIIAKRGFLPGKLFCAILAMALAMGSALAASGITMMISRLSYNTLMRDNETPRLVMILLSKVIQVIVFWACSRRKVRMHRTAKAPAIVLAFSSLLTMLCLVLIYALCLNSALSHIGNTIVTFVSLGILSISLVVFLLFEMFVKEEEEQLDLLSRVHLMETEQSFYKQIDVMYSDMRQWRHDYKNHLLTLQSIIESGNTERSIEYLTQMLGEPLRFDNILNIGNSILDSIVSAKLSYANSHDIDITVKAVYPDSLAVSDADLCSIVGNLLDNAIEACERMKEGKRFIDFSIDTKKKMCILTIRNSFSVIEFKNGCYISSKVGLYHGQGIRHIDELVAKHQGHVLREHSNGVFVTQIMLPLVVITKK